MRSPFRALFVLAGVTLTCSIFLSATAVNASVESDSARQKAKQILQDKKYGDQKDAPLSDQAQKLSRWLGEKEKDGTIKKRTDQQIKKQSQPKKTPAINPPVIGGLGAAGTILLWVFIAIIVGGLGFLVFKIIQNSKGSKKKSDDPDDEVVDIDWSEEEKVLEFVTDADLLEQLSEQAEAAGNLELALRYRFRAGLLRLSDRRIISFHPSVTNAQWQLLINNDSFDVLTRDFNDVTYGERPCDSTHLSRARQQWSVLTSEQKGS